MDLFKQSNINIINSEHDVWGIRIQYDNRDRVLGDEAKERWAVAIKRSIEAVLRIAHQNQ